MKSIEPLHVVRDPDGDANEGAVVAYGCEFPSGTIVVEWEPGAFPDGEQTEEPTQSIYGSHADAEQATGGQLRYGGDR
jgi:hypothetical protein